MSTLVRLAETGTVCVPKLGVNSLGREYWLPLGHVASWHSCFGGHGSRIYASLQVQDCHLIAGTFITKPSTPPHHHWLGSAFWTPHPTCPCARRTACRSGTMPSLK